MNDNHRYATGVTRAEQRERNRRYQAKQRRNRRWINLVAQASGIPEQTLLSDRNAEIVAEILRREHLTQ